MWGEFSKKFAALLNVPQPTPKDLNFLCLKKIIAIPNREPNPKDPDVVTLEKFGHIINWFGPLILNHKGFSILDKIRVLMQKEYVYSIFYLLYLFIVYF